MVVEVLGQLQERDRTLHMRIVDGERWLHLPTITSKVIETREQGIQKEKKMDEIKIKQREMKDTLRVEH